MKNDYNEQMHDLGYRDEEIKEKFGICKNNSEIIKTLIEIPQEEILMINANDLMNKYHPF